MRGGARSPEYANSQSQREAVKGLEEKPLSLKGALAVTDLRCASSDYHTRDGVLRLGTQRKGALVSGSMGRTGDRPPGRGGLRGNGHLAIFARC